jgi:hypothetical protein
MKKIVLSLAYVSAILMSSHAMACNYWEVEYYGDCYSGYENYYNN